MAMNNRYTGIADDSVATSDEIGVATTHNLEVRATPVVGDSYSTSDFKFGVCMISILGPLLLSLIAGVLIMYVPIASIPMWVPQRLPDTASFDRTFLSPVSVDSAISTSNNIGSSSYPAILLYKYENSDDLYGHIPKDWVDTEEPLLLVDQVTKGLGKGQSYLNSTALF